MGNVWPLILAERASTADTLDGLDAGQWAAPALYGGWSVHLTAAHILAGAEQTNGHFLKGLAANRFRFNTMIDRDAHRLGQLEPDEIVRRLRATTTTTNHPPGPAVTMLGEVVVHCGEIRQALRLPGRPSADAILAALNLYKGANFPVGTKKRIAGLRLVATDVDWSHGSGPEVTGPGVPLLLAMTGRASGLSALSGEGVAVLRDRLAAS